MILHYHLINHMEIIVKIIVIIILKKKLLLDIVQIIN